jgi:hypothetical protein
LTALRFLKIQNLALKLANAVNLPRGKYSKWSKDAASKFTHDY